MSNFIRFSCQNKCFNLLYVAISLFKTKLFTSLSRRPIAMIYSYQLKIFILNLPKHYSV